MFIWLREMEYLNCASRAGKSKHFCFHISLKHKGNILSKQVNKLSFLKSIGNTSFVIYLLTRKGVMAFQSPFDSLKWNKSL